MSQLIKLYKSTETNGPYTNLGGPPSSELLDTAYINGPFYLESIYASNIFSVIYIKNDNFSASSANSSAALAANIDYDAFLDVNTAAYAHNINLDLLKPSYSLRNYIHPAILPNGQFINTNQNVLDFVQNENLGKHILFINDILLPGEFFPILIRISTTGPLSTTFTVPIKLQIFSGVF